MKKLVIIQTASPDYRKPFFQLLKKKLKDRFQLYTGNEYFETSVKTDKNIDFFPVKNHFLLGRQLLFQTGMWKEIFKDNIIVLEMNPRNLSNWIILILRKIFNKKTILWGHAWPRKGKNSKSDRLRNLMRVLGSKIIVYTKQQRAELKQKMPKKEILAAPNALFTREQMQVTLSDNIKDIIYVGRLTKDKKVFFLLQAFHLSIPDIPQEANLLIVGAGEEEKKLKEYVEKNHLQNRVFFYGHISDYQKLKNLYSQSVFSVSPGYIGLSVTQSFGFGVPILVSKNENHSPEIEAVIENENALFFETDDALDFKHKLKNIYQNPDYWINKRQKIADFCKKEYSVESMAQVFINLLHS